MQSTVKLAERACLMRISISMPGKNRQDRQLSQTVKSEHKLGTDSGRWVKAKYPPWALEPIEKLANEARAYHAAITLPFDQGIGILPAALIMEYGDRMREFKGRFDNLVTTHFKARYSEMVEWAKVAHNGTFDQSDYPDVEQVCQQFGFRTEVQPVPGAEHFSETVKSLLGVDTESVDIRVNDALVEGQREVMRRLIAPVKAMAQKLAEEPKGERTSPIFRDTLVGNLKDIARIAPKLNIAGDPKIDGFVKEVEGLTRYAPDTLRDSETTRKEAAGKAAEILTRLEGYKF